MPIERAFPSSRDNKSTCMKDISLDFRFGLEAGKSLQAAIAGDFSQDMLPLKEKIEHARRILLDGTGPGNDFLGWLRLPEMLTEEALAPILEKAAEFRKKSHVFVCIGIGGSYLGARAVIEALKPQLAPALPDSPLVLYAGHHLGEDYMAELLASLDRFEYTLCVISKSGTTTEPAIAFRLLRGHLEKKYGKAEARRRIVAITDKAKGALKILADQEGYTSYVVPDNVGGRFSVLTPVGLFPLAVAGIDIRALARGAQRMRQRLSGENLDWSSNIAAQYALFRQFLYQGKGKKIELLSSFDSRFHYLCQWWTQLFGESEGKQHKGLFPAQAAFTTDLHSLGQYIQDGERLFLETLLSLQEGNSRVEIPCDEENLDGMDFVAGKRVSFVNEKAEEGTCMAHSQEGGVPVLRIRIPSLDEASLGQLLYFFEYACALSGYAMDINPFDQPGVEAYKKNMFRLLGK